MAEIIIHGSGGYDLPAGNHRATFVGVTPTTTQKGDALQWVFRCDNGNEVRYFSDCKATTKNKTGRWLTALSSKPLADGVGIDPDNYIGKPYLLIIEHKDGGGTTLNTFTPLF